MPLNHTKVLIRKIFGSTKVKTDGRLSHSAADSQTDSDEDEACYDEAFAEMHSLGQYTAIAATKSSEVSSDTSTSPKAASAASSSSRSASASKTAVFFARVPPTATFEELLELFSQFGKVVDLNLFKPFAEAKTSKGCGIVRYALPAAAAAAKASLHSKHRWTQESTAMVVEWVNEDKMRNACVKAGSSEIVFEPKTRSSKHRHTEQQQQQQHHSSSIAVELLQQQQQQSTFNPANLTSASADLAAAAAAGHSSNTCDYNAGYSSDQALLSPQGPVQSAHAMHCRQFEDSRSPFSAVNSRSKVQGSNMTYSGGFAMPVQPPPPPPRPASLLLQQQQQQMGQQQQQQPARWAPLLSSAGSGHVSADGNALLNPRSALAFVQQQQQQQQRRLLRSSYPGVGSSSSGLVVRAPPAPAAAAAAGEQADIVQAVLAASTAASGAHDAFIPTYGGLPSGSSVRDSLLLQQQQQQLPHCSTPAAALGFIEPSVSAQQHAFSSCSALQLQQQQQQLHLSGAFNASTTNTLSGAVLAARPNTLGVLDTQFEEQYEDQWAAAYGAGGYFDMPLGNTTSNLSTTSPLNMSSFSTGAGTAPMGSSSSSDVVAAMFGNQGVLLAASNPQLLQPPQQQQQCAEPYSLRAVSDPTLIRDNNMTGLRGLDTQSYTAGQQQQQQQQLLLQQQLIQLQQQQLAQLQQQQQGCIGAGTAQVLVPPSLLSPPAAAAGGDHNGLSTELQQRLTLAGNGTTGTPSPAPHLVAAAAAATGAEHAAAAAAGGGGGAADQRSSVVVATGPAIIPLLAPHIQTLTSMSGAVVHIAPADAADVALYVTGTTEQIRVAQGIVNVLLQKQ